MAARRTVENAPSRIAAILRNCSTDAKFGRIVWAKTSNYGEYAEGLIKPLQSDIV
jgi:hypothetical protein